MCRFQEQQRGAVKIIIDSWCLQVTSTAGEIKARFNPSSVQQARGHTSPEKAQCPSPQLVQLKHLIIYLLSSWQQCLRKPRQTKPHLRSLRDLLFLLNGMAYSHFCKATNNKMNSVCHYVDWSKINLADWKLGAGIHRIKGAVRHVHSHLVNLVVAYSI